MRSLPLLGDRYRLGPIIGTGGMGAVHRAYDERFGREVAVKVVRSGADATERERLRREAQYLARLDHPNLVAVYDAGTDSTATGESVWFAMELVEGPDLRHVLRDGGPLATADVARVLGATADALGVLHEAGVVHRDLKPANVLLSAHPSSGRWDVKLADLGIAQLMRADHLTSTGQVIGTAAYLSPEQVSGDRVGPASDVYALGLLVIEALTGEVAFPGGPVESAAARLVRAPEVPRGIEPAWRALLTDMTAREAADRPTTGEVVRRTALLPRSTAPWIAPTATAVLPGAVPPPRSLPDDDAPTEAITVVEGPSGRHHVAPLHETGWTPSLRARPRATRRRRRAVLSAVALAVAVTVAGGGAAMVVGGDAEPAAKAAVHDAAPSPSTTPTPKPTPSASSSASPKAEQKSAKTTEPAVEKTVADPAAEAATATPADALPADSAAARSALRQQVRQEVRDLRERLKDRLRDRLSDD